MTQPVSEPAQAEIVPASAESVSMSMPSAMTQEVATGDAERMPGFYAEYFALGSGVSSLSQIDFDAAPTASGAVLSLDTLRSEGAFWQGGPTDHFAARYTGSVEVAQAGRYTFYLTSDDGSALYVDGELVIDNDGLHGTMDRRVRLDLDAGTHEIEVRYFERDGEQSLRLEWRGPDSDGRRVVLDGDALSHAMPEMVDDGAGAGGDDSGMDHDHGTDAGAGSDGTGTDGDDTGTGGDGAGTGGDDTGMDHDHGTDDGTENGSGMAMQGLRASYFLLPAAVSSLDQIDFDATPSASGMVGSLDTLLSTDPFWDEGTADHFAARYQGALNVSKAGQYTFYLTSDDGSALYIDGKRVVNNDGLHGTMDLSVTLDLEAGAHEIEVRYFERDGEQSLRLEWQGPDSEGAREVIGGGAFSHMSDDMDDTGMDHDHGTDDGTDTGTDEGTGAGGDDTGMDHDHGTDDGTDAGTDEGTGTGGDDTGMDHDHGTDDGTDTGTDEGTGTGGDTGMGHDHGTDDGTDTGTDEGTGTGGDDTGMGHDHGSGSTDLPQTPAEIEAFVTAVMAEPDGHAHGDNAAMATEHMQLLDLVPRSEATHVAVANGDWFDPATWYQGRIPDADAKVLIPKGVSVTYDGESDASLFTVRVDGTLSFATDADTKMVVDTMVVSGSGRLEIGTADNPVDPDVTTQIIIADNGDIDVNWDPSLLSRGVISHGSVEIHGAEKEAFMTVARAPMAGDTLIELSELPAGWQVGDKLVLTGTHKQGWTWDNNQRQVVYQESEDEEVYITAINGNTVTIDRALSYDHDAPREDLAAYVANMTRNVTISSESGEASEIHHRGHVMFMHNDDVDVRYAAFEDLGRTDKSEPAFDVGTLSSVSADSNVKGRYSLHFHKTGTLDQENPAMSVGNVVDGSPGWGMVHHSSHADFVDNVVFDAFGAAYAAENGDETGSWINNIAIRAEGIGYGEAAAKQQSDLGRHDNGRTGDGFFFAGRLVEAADNVAANTTHGYVWMHRSAPSDPLSANLQNPEIAHGAEYLDVERTVIEGFHNNEAFGTQVGLVVVKASHWQDHDTRTILDGFLNWETSNGMEIAYTSHYTIKDVDLIGTRNSAPVADAATGVAVIGNAFDITFNGLSVDGFNTGVDMTHNEHTFGSRDADYGHVFIDADITDTRTPWAHLSTARYTVMNSDDLVEGRLSFVMQGDTTLSLGETFYFDGLKTDSIGTRNRQFDGDRQKIEPENINRLLQTDGYYVTASGQKVMLIEDFVADRATGELLKFSHVVTLAMTDAQLNGIGAQNNGLITFGGAPVLAQDDMAHTSAGEDVLIDVLVNDRDPDGGDVRVDGLGDPRHGDVYLQDDGSVLYSPNEGFTGTDSFTYWSADDEGFYTQATVTVTVDGWDPSM